jgi:hypothetical protein
LESEGIPIEVRAAAAAGEGAAAAGADVLVRDEDLELARGVLGGADDAADDGEAEQNAKDREAYFVRNWICPTCQEQSLVLLPRAKGWHLALLAFFLVLLIPAVVWFVAWAAPASDDTYKFSDGWTCTWAVTLAVLGGLWATADRDKRCEKCGWQEGGSK